MKRIISFLLTCLLCNGFFSQCKAQDSSKNNSDKSYFEAGVSYLNNNVYMGRKDSTNVPYLTPSFAYYNKSGFFAETSLSWLKTSDIDRIDLFEIEAGYSFIKNNFSATINAEKDFYNSQSKNVKSETKGSLHAGISYDFNFIKPSLNASYLFDSRGDVTGSFSAEHSFYFDDDNFEITPGISVNAGTQNYYDSYYRKRKFKGRKNSPRAPTIISGYVVNASDLKIMDYELSCPFDFPAGKFIFDFTPSYAIPVNPNTVVRTITPPSGNSVTKTTTEDLGNSFFWSAGITYSF